jgi:broad specificity phosphatase PhoE
VTTVFLIRHAVHEAGSDRLVGRLPGIHLSLEGRRQALSLALHLGDKGITALHTSPRERAVGTAEPIALATGLGLEIAHAADEVDFGIWAGKSFAELEDAPDWWRWNANRANATTPAGERMRDVAVRIAGHIDMLTDQYADGCIAIVTHAEVIRAAVLHYLDMPIGDYNRLQIDPASITTLATGAWGARLCGLNEVASRWS